MGQDSQWQGTGVDMEGNVPQCQDHKNEVKVMGVGVGAGMDEEEASWCVISIAGCLRDNHWGAPGAVEM